MVTPRQWDNLPNEKIKETVALEIARIMKASKLTIGTVALVELLYPIEAATIPLHTLSRQRIYKALPTLATGELAAYATRGAVQKSPYGTDMRPWLWHAPLQKCRVCKGTGYIHNNEADLIDEN